MTEQIDLKTVRAESEAITLYSDWKKVYPRAVKGVFRRVKSTLLAVLLGIFYIGPWPRWDRGPASPDQAVLFDFPGMRAYLFNIELWPQEYYYITGILIIACLGLFLATAMYGRVWCGYACPQTVWTDLFVWIERLIEGDRNARIKLDKGAWTAEKLAKKTAKHSLWAIVAAWTGATFIFYFVDAPTSLRELATGEAGIVLLSMIAMFAATTYMLAGFAREQVCTYMCPWPRIQASFFDEHSVVVAYDARRGEARGHAKIGQSFVGRGHCIDCKLCVQVCPVGIDIRDGLQMECIGCALCVDACNGVMERFGLPPNLVGWSSYAQQEGLTPTVGKKLWLRPRVLVYALSILAVTAVMAAAYGQRMLLEVNVLRDRAPLYVRLADGSVMNAYTVKVINRSDNPRDVELRLLGLDQASLAVTGKDGKGGSAVMGVKADSVETYRLLVTLPASEAHAQSLPILFEVRDPATQEVMKRDSVFITSSPR